MSISLQNFQLTTTNVMYHDEGTNTLPTPQLLSLSLTSLAIFLKSSSKRALNL